jgi:toxin FitB
LWDAAQNIFDEDLAGQVLSFDGHAADMNAEITASRRAAGKPISHRRQRQGDTPRVCYQ